jgi:hypothetical protein
MGEIWYSLISIVLCVTLFIVAMYYIYRKCQELDNIKTGLETVLAKTMLENKSNIDAHQRLNDEQKSNLSQYRKLMSENLQIKKTLEQCNKVFNDHGHNLKNMSDNITTQIKILRDTNGNLKNVTKHIEHKAKK